MPRRPPYAGPIFIDNQFGPMRLGLTRTREFCVPSILNPGTCGDGTVNNYSEQCDPPDDTDCAGLCAQDCTCPLQ